MNKGRPLPPNQRPARVPRYHQAGAPSARVAASPPVIPTPVASVKAPPIPKIAPVPKAPPIAARPSPAKPTAPTILPVPPISVPSAKAPEPPKKAATGKNRTVFIIVSVLVHVVFLLGAWYLVVNTITERPTSFKAVLTPPSEDQKRIEHTVQLAQKRESMSAPTQPKRVTTTGVSTVHLPDLEITPDTDSQLLSDTQGLDLPGRGASLGLGGLGNSPSMGAPAQPFFGVQDAGAGLKGTLYDIKQTASRRPTDFTVPQYHNLLREFIRQNWRPSILDKFYKAPVSMYASQILIPCISANEAPKAFSVEKEVQPSRWVIHYQGKVTAPETGTFRFVGAADDILAVRFQGRLVLDGSLATVAPEWTPTATYTNPLRLAFAVAYNGLQAGNWFQVTQGNTYSIEILLGEQPGGGFFGQLMIEKQGAEYKKDSAGNPILPIFRMQNTTLSNDPLSIAHTHDGPIWKIVTNP